MKAILTQYSQIPPRSHHFLIARCLSASAQSEFQGKAIEPKSQKKVTAKKPQDTSSFVMNMFLGQLKVEQVFPYPNALTGDQFQTLEMLVDPTKKFYQECNDALKNDMIESVDESTLESLKALGAFGLQIPQDYGGIGLNNTQYARLAEITGENDLGIGVVLGAHQSIGFKGILLYGNEAQKRKYLPDLAWGKKIAAYCLTEPGSGSDASSIKTRAELSKDKKHFILNGSKIWISNGGIAEIFTVFAKTPVVDNNGETKEKMVALIVERSFGGVTSGPPEKKMGIKASNTAEVYFDDVKVPVENVLGEVGEGFKVAMNILNNGRFGMAATLSGTMKTAIKKAVEHATNRSQFGNKICTYGAIQEKLARMAMAQYITESMAYVISSNMDRGYTDLQLEAAISKIFASEAAWFVTDEAIQIMGGMGYMREAGLEKILRDIRVFRIFEGVNDILRLFVALTGLQNAGGHLKELQNAMKNPTANLGLIFDEGTKRIWRAVGMSSAPSIAEHVHPNLKGLAALTSKAFDHFGGSVEHLLVKHGKSIINEQFLLHRLANAAIDIFSMATVLSRCTRSLEQNFTSAEYEELLTKVICAEAAERVTNNLNTLKDGDKHSNFDRMKSISTTLCKLGYAVQQHPLGI